MDDGCNHNDDVDGNDDDAHYGDDGDGWDDAGPKRKVDRA